ncbi:MAG: hypothetical protein M3T49_00795 [Candidatus Eremiobacteraeota bacterium]|nr:hypothetical protein [Candidatus Eremiobacteraeota bacterium]
MDAPQEQSAVNPYHYQSDEALEVFARGAIDDAIARSTASPRSFGYYSMMAAKQIARYVLENFQRKKA